MKRSKRIRLILIGSVSGGMLAGCEQNAPLSSGAVYTNNFFVPGVGYYHAPFRAWYRLPYNHFDAATQRYFYGGQWGTEPFESVTNISSPTAQAVTLAESARTDVRRGGFGSTYYGGGHSHFFG